MFYSSAALEPAAAAAAAAATRAAAWAAAWGAALARGGRPLEPQPGESGCMP